MAIATCETLGQGLVDWLNNASQSELDLFCQTLTAKCGDTSTFLLGDAQTITITGDGSGDNPYRISVAVDSNPDNALAKGTDGLLVLNAALSVDANTGDVNFTDNKGVTSTVFNLSEVLNTVEHEDTPTISIQGLGDDTAPLTADVKLDPDAGNAIVTTANGLLTHNMVATWDQPTSTLTFKDNLGNSKSVDLSEFLINIHVTDAEFDPQTTMLTLRTNDPENPEITVNLGDLSKSTTQDTPSISFSGDGSAVNPMSANVNLSADDDNRITEEADGLMVGPELPDAPTTDGTYALVVDVNNGTATYSWEVLGC